MELKQFLEHGQSSISNLIFKYYKRLGLDEKELVMYLLLTMEEQAYQKPVLEHISHMMNLSIEEVYGMLSQLEHKGWIRLHSKANDEGKIDDFYDLTPVYRKIDQVLLQEKRVKKERDGKVNIQSLLSLLEQEIARPLSPIEIEQVNQWIIQDDYHPELIRLAFREAIYNKVRHPFQYADRILQRWQQERITTPNEAVSNLQENRKYKEDYIVSQASKQEETMQVPLFDDWS